MKFIIKLFEIDFFVIAENVCIQTTAMMLLNIFLATFSSIQATAASLHPHVLPHCAVWKRLSIEHHAKLTTVKQLADFCFILVGTF